MENSAYVESVAGDRAVLPYEQDEEGALDGAQLISAETDPDVQREQDIFIFINDQPTEKPNSIFFLTSSPSNWAFNDIS